MLSKSEAATIRKELYRISLGIPENHKNRLEDVYLVDDLIARYTEREENVGGAIRYGNPV